MNYEILEIEVMKLFDSQKIFFFSTKKYNEVEIFNIKMNCCRYFVQHGFKDSNCISLDSTKEKLYELMQISLVIKPTLDDFKISSNMIDYLKFVEELLPAYRNDNINKSFLESVRELTNLKRTLDSYKNEKDKTLRSIYNTAVENLKLYLPSL